MLVIVIIYPIKDKASEINIFKSNFVNKFKYRFKIIHKNKILPLQTKLKNIDNSSAYVKIQLICYDDKFILNNLFEGIESFDEFYPNRKIKDNITKFYNLKVFIVNMSFMVYEKYDPIINQKNRIKLFGEDFVKKNKDKCLITNKSNYYPLQEYFFIKKEEDDKELDIIYFNLIEYDIIYDKSFMFDSCAQLASLSTEEVFGNVDIQLDKLLMKDNNNDYYNNIYSFQDSYSLSVSDNEKKSTLSNLNPLYNNYSFSSEIDVLSSIVKNKNSISTWSIFPISFYDISNWNTSYVTNISYMFNGCLGLKSLPDISKWNTYRINFMEHFLVIVHF